MERLTKQPKSMMRAHQNMCRPQTENNVTVDAELAERMMIVKVIIAKPRQVHGTHNINVQEEHSLTEVQREIIKILREAIKFDDNNGLYLEVGL